MSLTRTCRFKVETSWQELVNRRIHAIEINLKEITFLNQGDFLIARGAFKREIIYVEFDGRFRKVDDKVQFEVVVGKAVPEPLPLFRAELKQDYYIYQPRQIGDSQAVLEQAFLLVVQEVELETYPEILKTLFLDWVIERRVSTQMIRIPVAMESIVTDFREFTGKLIFDPLTGNVISCRVLGSLQFTASNGSIVNISIDQSISWLADPMGQAWKSGTHCRLSGNITDSTWIKTQEHGGELELKIDYTCLLLQSLPLVCVLAPSGGEHKLPSKVHSIKAMVLLFEKEHRLGKTFVFPWNSGILTEIRVEVIGRNDRLTKKGILLEAQLKIEAYYLTGEGVEAFHQWETGLFELVEDWSFPEQQDELRLDAALQIEPVVFSQSEAEVHLNFTAAYQLKIFQRNTVAVLEDSKNGKTVLAKSLVEQRKFAVMREAAVVLKRKSVRVQGVQARFGKLSCLPKPGWMKVEGELLISVSYLHLSGKAYEEQFKIDLKESFVWDGLVENHTEIELQPFIEFTAYEQNGTKVNYRYLIRYEAGLFRECEFKIRVLPDFVPTVDSSLIPENTHELWDLEKANSNDLTVVFEQEVPLKLGFPKEIARHKSFIAHFEYRDAQNAILTEGVLETDLEYWDEDGFLRQERLDIPFWKFIQYNSNFQKISTEGSLFPEIIRVSIVPVNAWPWQKGTVRVTVELALKRDKGVKPE